MIKTLVFRSIVGTLDTLRRLYENDSIPFDGSSVPLKQLNASLAFSESYAVNESLIGHLAKTAASRTSLDLSTKTGN